MNAQNQYFNVQISLTPWRSVVVFADYQLMAAMGTLLKYLTPPPPIDARPVDLVVFGWLPTDFPLDIALLFAALSQTSAAPARASAEETQLPLGINPPRRR